MRILPGDLTNPRVIALLQTHVTAAQASTAPGSAHALDVHALQAPDIQFWTAWQGEELAGCAALKRLADDHGEVKSMHVAQAMRGQGVATALLLHVIGAARAAGLQRLSLETGSWDYFKPAHALYRKHGFLPCTPFADYREDPNSHFFTLRIPAA